VTYLKFKNLELKEKAKGLEGEDLGEDEVLQKSLPFC